MHTHIGTVSFCKKGIIQNNQTMQVNICNKYGNEHCKWCLWSLICAKNTTTATSFYLRIWASAFHRLLLSFACQTVLDVRIRPSLAACHTAPMSAYHDNASAFHRLQFAFRLPHTATTFAFVLVWIRWTGMLEWNGVIDWLEWNGTEKLVITHGSGRV